MTSAGERHTPLLPLVYTFPLTVVRAFPVCLSILFEFGFFSYGLALSSTLPLSVSHSCIKSLFGLHVIQWFDCLSLIFENLRRLLRSVLSSLKFCAYLIMSPRSASFFSVETATQALGDIARFWDKAKELNALPTIHNCPIIYDAGNPPVPRKAIKQPALAPEYMAIFDKARLSAGSLDLDLNRLHRGTKVVANQ